MPRYARIRSWHITVTFTRTSALRLRCGRTAVPNADTSDTLDLNDKTCESCLRLTARDQEAFPEEQTP